MIFRVVIQTFLLTAILMLGGCAIPTAHGPYYLPVYPDMDSPDSPWLPYFGSTVQSRLRFRFSEHCYMQLQAIPSNPDLILSWDLERPESLDPRKRPAGHIDPCNYRVGNEEVSIEDIKTGRHRAPESVHRIFYLPPKLDFRSGMQPYSSYFSDTPPEQQTYTTAIRLRLDVDKNIPDSVSVKLPDILIGNQRFSIPMLTLKKIETGGNIKAYVPVNAQPMTNAESITRFAMSTTHHRTGGAMGMFHAGATLWHEEKGAFRVASSLSGRDDVKTSTMITPGISGDIFIQVMSGKGMALADSRATWVTEDGKEIVQHIDQYMMGLVAYRTRLADVMRFTDKDFGARFILLFPDFQPERAKLTLPRLDAVGKTLPIKPIDFEYKSGGVGFVAWP